MPGLKRTQQTEEFKALHLDGRSMGEAKDCAVVAVAAAAGVSYKVAHAALRAVGRTNGRGTRMSYTEAALAALGFAVRRWTSSEVIAKIASYPIRATSITTHHPRRLHASWKDEGTLLFRTCDHILCVKDGVNLDWSVNNSLKVIEVYTVTQVQPAIGSEEWMSA